MGASQPQVLQNWCNFLFRWNVSTPSCSRGSILRSNQHQFRISLNIITVFPRPHWHLSVSRPLCSLHFSFSTIPGRERLFKFDLIFQVQAQREQEYSLNIHGSQRHCSDAFVCCVDRLRNPPIHTRLSGGTIQLHTTLSQLRKKKSLLWPKSRRGLHDELDARFGSPSKGRTERRYKSKAILLGNNWTGNPCLKRTNRPASRLSSLSRLEGRICSLPHAGV